MENLKSKPLSSFVFRPLLFFIFIRPFFSSLTYPTLEIYYEGAVIFLAVLTFILEARYRFRILPKAFDNFPVIALFLAYAISTVYSINPGNSIRETIKFVSLFAAFFMVSQADNRQKNHLIKTIVVAASIISLYSIYQYFWGYQHTIDYLKETGSDFLMTSSYARDILLAKRAIGTFPSPNILASYLIMALFLALSGRGETSTMNCSCFRLDHLYWCLIPFSISIALLLTKSMGAWLSLIFALSMLFLISYKSLKRHKIIMAVSIVFIISALTFILLSRWERLMNLENPQNSITQRLNYWRTAIAIIKDRYLLGVGPGNFKEVFLDYQVGTGITKYAHNLFLHQWSETGILGLAALFYLLVNFFRKITRKLDYKFIYLAAAVFIAHNLIEITYFFPETALFFWVLLGIPVGNNLGAE